MSAAVHRVDPRSVAEPIKALFRANDNPGAATWFDRTFGESTPKGASSWVTTEADGRIVAHVAALPMRIVHAGLELSGAVFCNLMADREHRTFFPIYAVVKRAVRDLQADGAAFIMTNPSNAGAVAIMQAAGVKQVATHSRFLCLLGDTRPAVDRAINLHMRLRAMLAPTTRTRRVEASAAAEWTERNLARGAAVTACRTAGQYAARYEAFGGPQDLGFILLDSTDREVGAAIVRADQRTGAADIVTLRCTARSHIPGAAAAIGAALRPLGLRRLNALAVVGSSFARGLLRGGFIARNEPWAIVGVGFTDSARAALAAMGDGDLERVDLD